MGHYTKLAILAFRVFGLTILLYAVPILLLGIVRILDGSAVAEGSPDRGTFFAWLVYAIAGALMFGLARRFGRLAARGLDPDGTQPPAV